MKFKPFFTEHEFITICAEAADSAHAKASEKDQTVINMLLHFVNELGEFSQCERKGRKIARGFKADEFIKSTANLIPHQQSLIYNQLLKGTKEDELADCFLVICVIIGRNFDRFKIGMYYHEKTHFLNWDSAHVWGFDSVTIWALENALKIIKSVASGDEEISNYLHSFIALANNIQYMAQLLKIDLITHVRAKMAYNEIR